MSPYVVPALIAACAAGLTVLVRRSPRARDDRADELWDEEFMTALFHPEHRATETDRAETFTDLDAGLDAYPSTDPGPDTPDAEPVVPSPRIPRQDPALAELASAPGASAPAPEPAAPPLRGTTPHPSHGLAPMLPAHLTGAHLLGVAGRGTPITGLRSGTAGGLDVFDFADGGSIVVMPADPDVAALVEAALAQGQSVTLLGTSEVGGGRALTFGIHESTAYCLADRVYARPAA